MTPQSCKAKGRKLQQFICNRLHTAFSHPPYNLEADDFLSRSMGAPGVDIIMSPAARKAIGNLAIECKNVESLNVHKIFGEHHTKYKSEGAIPILMHKKNKSDVLVTMSLADFINFLVDYVAEPNS